MIDNARLRRSNVRLCQRLSIPFKEPVEQRVTTGSPRALTHCQIDRSQEPNNIDQCRASSGVVEIIKTPRVLRHRELFNVRVAVETCDRQIPHLISEHFAHARSPGSVDESKVRERISPQPIEQIAGGNLDGSRFGP